MPSAVNLRVTCPYFMFPGDTVWTENIEGFRQFPVGTRLVLAEARVNFFQEDQPVPLSASCPTLSLRRSCAIRVLSTIPEIPKGLRSLASL